MGSDVLYTDPEEVFEAFSQCQRLVRGGVRHYGLSKIEQEPIATGPRARWVLQDFVPHPPRHPRYLVTVPNTDGARRELDTICVADMEVQVEVSLLTDVNGPMSQWELFRLYTLAAFDVLKVEKDYSLSGKPLPRDQLSTATNETRARLTFRILVFDIQPFARLNDDNVSLKANT